MKKLILGLVALAVLGGGAAGAYFYFRQSAEAAIPPAGHEETAKAEENHGESAKEGGDGHGAPAGPTYVKLDPLVVPVMDGEGISQMVSMVVALEVGSEADAKKVEDLQPRIKDAFIQSLYGIFSNQIALDKGVVKVGVVKKRLADITQKVMGEGIVKDVLLQQVQQNPI